MKMLSFVKVNYVTKLKVPIKLGEVNRMQM